MLRDEGAGRLRDVALVAAAPDPTKHAPWALVLTDGTRCARGKTAAYRCKNGLVLRGQVIRSQSAWRLGDSAIRTAYW